MKRQATFRHLAATVLSLLVFPAQAATGEASVVEIAAVAHLSASEPEPSPGDVVGIRVGRALDLEGAPVYSARSMFSDTAGVAIFSNRPIRTPRSVSTSAIPSGAPLRATLTSGFGMRVDPILGTRRLHSGIDLAAPNGSPIVATSDGLVGKAGWNGGYGLYVSLEHGGGLQTRYGHMSRLAVAAGEMVKKGDVIGYVGSTGRSTGPHLHYEMRLNGIAVRPTR
jgi:murein DD-endopeptidase MepM/ murein hydrolase activator NlpD